MGKCLSGLETEYAIAAVNRDEERLPTDTVIRWVLDAAEALPHLSDGGCGMFLANGARFYIDAGAHPEYATPEVTNPWDAVRHTMAGDRLLDRLARTVGESTDVGEVYVLKSNVDYLTGATWGCHESYLHCGHRMNVMNAVLPHLVTRIIYTGAGGFNAFDPGIKFTLSPRVWHLQSEISEHSTNSRGILHTKNEPLAGGGGCTRLHLVCGESLCGELPQLLRNGVTSLIIAMAAAGVDIGREVRLAQPLQAMRSIASDPECSFQIEKADGGSMTAVQIQRHYLEAAASRLGAFYMPGWAPDICAVWKRVLDKLEQDPVSLTTSLDWKLRRSLFDEHICARGFSAQSIHDWSQVLSALNKALESTEHRGKSVTVNMVLGQDSPIRDHVQHIGMWLESKGLQWDGLESFIALRHELFEIDVRFAQVGERGIFNQMNAAGVLDHHVAGVDRLDEAVDEPPPDTRARTRGEWVRKLSARSGERYLCEWSSIWDQRTGSLLQLSSPWDEPAKWNKSDRGSELEPELRTLQRILNRRRRRRPDNSLEESEDE